MTSPLSDSVTAQIAGFVEASQRDGRVPGVSVGVVRNGQVIHGAFAGRGLARDTQSRIGSISKTFTATLLMQLRDAGVVDLDAPLSAYLPALDLGPVTVRQVLAHFSGLRREPHGDWWERAAGGDVDSLLADVDGGALIHRPMRRHHYSNLGYGLLGAVIEKVTGDTWWDALRARVIEPLGLTRTSYFPIEPYATGYVVHPYDGTLREEPRHDAGAMAPAGQLWSTLDDLGRWAGFLAGASVARDERRQRPASIPATPDPAVLAPETLDEMCHPVSMHDADWSGAHGLGLETFRSGDRLFVGHTGSMPGYLAALLVHRGSGYGVAAFVNAYTMSRGSISGLAVGVLNRVLDLAPPQAQSWQPAAAPAPAHVIPLLGAWWWMGRAYDAVWDGELVLTYRGDGATPWRFAESGVDRWRCHSGMNHGESMIVRRDASGQPAELDIATFVFTREVWPDLG